MPDADLPDTDLPTTRSISVPGVVLWALGQPRTTAAAVRFVGTVLKDFFALQFAVRLGLRRIPVVNVDHPIDERIPFEPGRIGTYLDFIPSWIRPLGWIGRRFGARAFATYAVEYLGLIERCYREAAEVYRAGMTTTRRPRYYKGRFLAIHLFDPHLLCVPSLHVMIVALTWTFFRRAFAELGLGASEREALDAELFGGAVDITESVLYIKQHSVNCVPAALYAMTRITPDDLTPADVDTFVAHLFADGQLDAASEVRAHIAVGYAGLLAAGASDDAWPATVQRYIRGISARTAR